MMGCHCNMADDFTVVFLAALVTIIFINIGTFILPYQQKSRLIKILCCFPLFRALILSLFLILSFEQGQNAVSIRHAGSVMESSTLFKPMW